MVMVAHAHASRVQSAVSGSFPRLTRAHPLQWPIAASDFVEREGERAWEAAP